MLDKKTLERLFEEIDKVQDKRKELIELTPIIYYFETYDKRMAYRKTMDYLYFNEVSI